MMNCGHERWAAKLAATTTMAANATVRATACLAVLMTAAAASYSAPAPDPVGNAASVSDAAAPAAVPVKRKTTDATWKTYTARTLDDLPGFVASGAPPATLDRFGGLAERKRKATGFFHVTRDENGRWWLVDPEGGLFLNVGMVALNPHHGPAFTAKFGGGGDAADATWEKKTAALLRENGFNGAGCWSTIPVLRAPNVAEPLVYTVLGSDGLPGVSNGGGGFMSAFGHKLKVAKQGTGHSDYANNCIPVFHPDFAAFCDTYAAPIAARKSDPYLLGYYSDNELPLPQLKKYLALSPDDPAMGSSYRAARLWWDARKGVKDAPVSEIGAEDEEAWAEYTFGRYFELTTSAIRKYDPNHLCLGSRLNLGNRSPGSYRAAGKYLDVIAVNMYFVWDGKERSEQLSRWAGKPIVITEFYAKGADSGFANTGGAGWLVPTQKDRGLFYQTFTLGLLESKGCVGWHWFKYMDNDPDDTKADPSNRDSNKGIVTNSYEPYTPLLDEMRPLNRAVYALADYFDAAGVGK